MAKNINIDKSVTLYDLGKGGWTFDLCEEYNLTGLKDVATAKESKHHYAEVKDGVKTGKIVYRDEVQDLAYYIEKVYKHGKEVSKERFEKMLWGIGIQPQNYEILPESRTKTLLGGVKVTKRLCGIERTDKSWLATGIASSEVKLLTGKMGSSIQSELPSWHGYDVTTRGGQGPI